MRVEFGKIDQKGPKLLGMIFLVVFAVSSLYAQFSPYSIKKYGQKIEENFHTIRTIRQDSLHRLLADQWIFDGYTFSEKDGFSGERFYTKNPAQFYVEINPYTFLYIDNGAIKDTINVSEYTDYPNASLTNHGDTIIIINAHGALFYTKENGAHHFLNKVEVPSTEVRHYYQIKDTFFFKDNDRTFYATEENPNEVVYYGQTGLSHFPTFYLPGERIVLNQALGDTIIGPNSPWGKVMEQFADDEMLQNLVDARGRLWLSLRSSDFQGMYFCLPAETKLRPVQYAYQEKIFAYTLYEDHQGSIWAGTDGSGLYQIYEKGIQILGKEIGLGTDNIWSIQQTESGNLLLTSDKPWLDIITADYTVKQIPTQTAYTPLLIDANQDIWMQGGGAVLFNQDIEHVKTYAKSEGLYSRTPISFYQDTEGIFWVGTRKCLHQYEEGRFIQYPIPGIGEFDLIFNIVEVTPGTLLVAVKSGRAFIFENESFTEVPGDYSRIFRLIKDARNNIWVATAKDGIMQYDNGRLNSIGGLPGTIYQIQYDLLGNLWGVTDNNRIFSVPIEQLEKNSTVKSIRYYGSDFGLPLIDLNTNIQPSSTVLSNGKVMFPNIYGALVIDPHIVEKNRKKFYTLIHLDSTTILPEGKIKLSSGSSSATIRLTPLSLLPNHPVEYAYQSSDGWKMIQDYRQFQTDHLEPGKNKLTIKGRYVNHDWQKPIDFQLIVPPLYHQTLWFKTLATLLLGILMYLIILWRTKVIKNQNLKLQSIINAQTSEIKQEKEHLAASLKIQQNLTHELKLNQTSKNRMYAQISHEFRSPLQAVKSYFSGLENQLDKEEKRNIMENLNNLISVSDEILELSKAESGNLKSFKNWYNINSIIDDQIQLKTPLLTEKNIEILFKERDQRVLVYFDLNLMQKVFANLLSNAIKFSPLNSTISIFTYIKDGYYEFYIHDEGIGIVDSEIENITSPYIQGSNNAVGGTGIGLSLVNEILKLHDSKISITSTLGKGSSFYFLMPVPIKEVESLSNNDKVPLSEQMRTLINPHKIRILCLDDNTEILKFLRNSLSKDYYVITHQDGSEVLEVLEEINPQLIISDVNMPIMDGLEFLKSVRKINQYKTTPFIFLTGSASEETEVLGFASGADSILHKPIQLQSLLTKIRRTLDQKEAIKTETTKFFAQKILPGLLQDDDQMLLKTLEEVILSNIQDSQLKSSDIAEQIGMGEKTLRNKVKNLTGMTVKEYLRLVRLETAKKLVYQEYGTYGEIATAVGFSSLSYFRKSYKSYFKDAERNNSLDVP